MKTIYDDLMDSLEKAGYWGPVLLLFYLVVFVMAGIGLFFFIYLILLEIQG